MKKIARCQVDETNVPSSLLFAKQTDRCTLLRGVGVQNIQQPAHYCTTINPRKQAVHLPHTYFRAVVEADDDSLVYVVRVPAKHEGLRSVEMHRSLEALDVP
jgi:hypothetical protein